MSFPSLPLKLNPAPNFFSEYSVVVPASLKDAYATLGTSAGHERVCRLFKGCTSVDLLHKDEIALPIPTYPDGKQLADVAVRTAKASDDAAKDERGNSPIITRQHFTMVETIPLLFGLFNSQVMLKGTMSWDNVALTALSKSSDSPESGVPPAQETPTLYALYETVGNMGIMVWKLRIFTRDQGDPSRTKVTEKIEGWAPGWIRPVVQNETTKGHRIPKLDAQLFDSKSPHLTSGVKIGIGLFNRDTGVVGNNNKPIKVIEWTLILHHKNYRSSSRTIHGIYKSQPDPTSKSDAERAQDRDEWVWKLRDPQNAQSHTDLSEPIGIIHVANFPWSHELLQSAIETKFKAEKGSDNPGMVSMWSSSGWTIRVLHYLQEWYGTDTGFRLPCSTRRLHDLIKEKATALKAMNHRNGKVPIVNLDDSEPYNTKRKDKTKNRGNRS
ncbi:hypothetical protein JR316_0005778 [Psilocybe cubensis]|uniref:Uncharacterized protein n=2 Tax=Psilocybe cubensis TaxID=181762 RepID=A0ACB8H1A2_PSICU|nr:hypothetical protein JR316_0005778 [Psilocybe cubensis]KAH9481256.1 hypothetical protein JR316_0005778 [Psilocybe cubensis]